MKLKTGTSQQQQAASEPQTQGEVFSAETDLASRRLGASVIAASDESFGEKENLLAPDAAAFEPGRYSHRGEIVDGWETRRRREPGVDWALVRLGAPGIITSIDVDTSFFTGNYPEFCTVEACGCEGYPSPKDLMGPGTDWVEIVERSPLRGDTHNMLPVTDGRRFTHVRLTISPDGGVARLRVFGNVVPDPRRFDGLTIDLSSQDHGGAVVASSDGFYGSARTLNRPDRARTMGEGWETRRRRDDGHDFAVIRLALAGQIRQVEIDTAHFKYNASAAISLDGSSVETGVPTDPAAWGPLVPKTRLQPDTRHVLPVLDHRQPVTLVRVDAFPDGGLSRVRVWGAMDSAARFGAGLRWFNSLPDSQAAQCLFGSGVSEEAAAAIISERPLSRSWLADAVRGNLMSEAITAAVKDYGQLLVGMLQGG